MFLIYLSHQEIIKNDHIINENFLISWHLHKKYMQHIIIVFSWNGRSGPDFSGRVSEPFFEAANFFQIR